VFVVEIKVWQQCYILPPPNLGLVLLSSYGQGSWNSRVLLCQHKFVIMHCYIVGAMYHDVPLVAELLLLQK
jgi:hypothetical protein